MIEGSKFRVWCMIEGSKFRVRCMIEGSMFRVYQVRQRRENARPAPFAVLKS